VPTTMPLTPREPNGPIVTTKFWLAGKLWVCTVTVVSVTTLEMLIVGIVAERAGTVQAKMAAPIMRSANTKNSGRINERRRPPATLSGDNCEFICYLLTYSPVHLAMTGAV